MERQRRVVLLLLLLLPLVAHGVVGLSTGVVEGHHMQLESICTFKSLSCCNGLTCPHANAVCCPNGISCCPQGSVCLPVETGKPQQCAFPVNTAACPCLNSPEPCHCAKDDKKWVRAGVVDPGVGSTLKHTPADLKIAELMEKHSSIPNSIISQYNSQFPQTHRSTKATTAAAAPLQAEPLPTSAPVKPAPKSTYFTVRVNANFETSQANSASLMDSVRSDLCQAALSKFPDLDCSRIVVLRLYKKDGVVYAAEMKSALLSSPEDRTPGASVYAEISKQAADDKSVLKTQSTVLKDVYAGGVSKVTQDDATHAGVSSPAVVLSTNKHNVKAHAHKAAKAHAH